MFSEGLNPGLSQSESKDGGNAEENLISHVSSVIEQKEKIQNGGETGSVGANEDQKIPKQSVEFSLEEDKQSVIPSSAMTESKNEQGSLPDTGNEMEEDKEDLENFGQLLDSDQSLDMFLFVEDGQKEETLQHEEADKERKTTKRRKRKSSASKAAGEEGEEKRDKESEEKTKEQLSALERCHLYSEYERLIKEYEEAKAKNNYLMSKLVVYYKNKKMHHVFHEEKIPLDTQKGYEKQLDEFERLTGFSNRELKKVEDEITDLGFKCEAKEEKSRLLFQSLRQTENEIAKGIIGSKSDESHEHRYIERCLKREKVQLNNLMKLRLDYIKVRNKVRQTQEALDALDSFGPNLRLIDYEQLKVDNRNLHDKLEEKDLELAKVRRKCQHTMQTLAHKREKTYCLESDIAYLEERFETVTGEFEDVREELNTLKQERDHYRRSTTAMKEKSGLLSKPKLLADMSNTIRQVEILQENVERLCDEYNIVVERIERLRKNMASAGKLRRIKTIMENGNEIKVNQLN